MRLLLLSLLPLSARRYALAVLALVWLAGIPVPVSLAAEGFEGWAPLGDYELTALREGSSFRATLPTREGNVLVAFHPVAVHARSYHAERVDRRGVRRGIGRPLVATWTGKVVPDSGLRDFAKLTHLPGGRVSGLLRVAGVLYDLASEPGRGEFLLTLREITPEELAELLRGCGLEASAELLGETGFAPGEPVAASATTELREIELGTEADAPFVAQSGGSSEANARILSIVNAVNGIYEADLALTNRIVVQRAWSGSDPYNSSDSATLLGEFRNQFSAAVGTPTDDAQLFSGRDFESNVIGRAWVASACGSYRYGVNQGLGLADSALHVLVAHEEGHNLGADHSDSGVMAPILDPNASWFSDASRAQIGAYTASVACLESIASGAPPLLEPVGPQSVVEGGALDLMLAGSDPDGDPIVFGATPLLPGAQISPDGHFVYAPPFSAAGCGGSKVVTVEFFVSDSDGNRASESVPISVFDSPTGAWPVLLDPADRSLRAGENLSIQLSASDADGDTLAFSSPALPSGSSLSASGVFSWHPTNEAVGLHLLSFVATDCTGRSASQSVAIQVDAVAPPHLASLTPATASVGAQVEIAGTGLAGATVEVFFGTKVASVYSVTATRLVVVVPSQQKRVSQLDVRVVRDGLASDNSLPFSIQGSSGGGKGGRKRLR